HRSARARPHQRRPWDGLLVYSGLYYSQTRAATESPPENLGYKQTIVRRDQCRLLRRPCRASALRAALAALLGRWLATTSHTARVTLTERPIFAPALLS